MNYANYIVNANNNYAGTCFLLLSLLATELLYDLLILHFNY